MDEHLHAYWPVHTRLQILLHCARADGHSAARGEHTVNLLESLFLVGGEAKSPIWNDDIERIIWERKVFHISRFEINCKASLLCSLLGVLYLSLRNVNTCHATAMDRVELPSNKGVNTETGADIKHTITVLNICSFEGVSNSLIVVGVHASYSKFLWTVSKVSHNSLCLLKVPLLIRCRTNFIVCLCCFLFDLSDLIRIHCCFIIINLLSK